MHPGRQPAGVCCTCVSWSCSLQSMCHAYVHFSLCAMLVFTEISVSYRQSLQSVCRACIHCSHCDMSVFAAISVYIDLHVKSPYKCNVEYYLLFSILQALKILRTSEFLPYVVFIEAPDFEVLKAMNRSAIEAGVVTKQLTVSSVAKMISNSLSQMIASP